MKPIFFSGANCIVAEHNQHFRMPARSAHGGCGVVISCWQLTFKDRLRLLFTGKLWVQSLTFGHPHQPLLLTSQRPFPVPTNPQPSILPEQRVV